jgi:hypothetical protein
MLARIFYTKTTGQSNEPMDYETNANNAIDACDEAYRQFNRVDGDEEITIKGYERRSMSKGDIVCFPNERTWFLCVTEGWKPITDDFAQAWLGCVEFKDAMMGLDWCLTHKPGLKLLD